MVGWLVIKPTINIRVTDLALRSHPLHTVLHTVSPLEPVEHAVCKSIFSDECHKRQALLHQDLSPQEMPRN